MKRKYLNDNPAAPAMPQMQAGQSVASARERLRRRRGEILAETAAGLLSGRDPDREVMPQLFVISRLECGFGAFNMLGRIFC